MSNAPNPLHDHESTAESTKGEASGETHLRSLPSTLGLVEAQELIGRDVQFLSDAAEVRIEDAAITALNPLEPRLAMPASCSQILLAQACGLSGSSEPLTEHRTLLRYALEGYTEVGPAVNPQRDILAGTIVA